MRLALFLLSAALLAQPPVFQQKDRAEGIRRAAQQLDNNMERWFGQAKPPGLVYGLVADGQLVHVKSMGIQDLQTKTPVSERSAFRIASMTKSFTAAAMLKLRDEGRLSLEDPVTKWIPEFAAVKLPTKDSAAITLRQLISHGIGLPEDNPWGDRQLAQSDAVLRDWLKRGLPFSTAPGTQFEYSNYGFALAGQVIQKASGMDYRAYIEQKILAPLNMKETSLEPSAIPAGVRVTGYGRRDGEYFVIPSLAHGSFGAMGGLVTTANDMARWVAFQLSAWPPRDETEAGPLRRSSLREMQQAWRGSGFSAVRRTPDAPLLAQQSDYGYGLGIMQNCTVQHSVGHGGGLPGFGSYMYWLPEYGVGVFAMANITYAGPSRVLMDTMNRAIEQKLLQPRVLPESAALTSARRGLWKFWQSNQAADLAGIAADNLAMDLPLEMRAKQWSELKSKLGDCEMPTAVKPENWLRGSMQTQCSKGKLSVFFTLAPTQPPTIQQLDAEAIFTPGPQLLVKAKEAAAAWSAQLGSCQTGDVLAGDGETSATFALQCERGPAQLRVNTNGVTLLPAPGLTCSP
jgi:CubicO group peptidase (beta-lactamase class C family)